MKDFLSSFGNVNERASAFQHAREAHQLEIIEDYVELIDDLIHEKGEARAVDLAALLGVSAATVNKTLQRLQRDGYVTSEPYRSIFLTDKGRDTATECRRRHSIVLAALQAIGVDQETARRDAEGIEHHVSETTLQALVTMTQRLQKL